MRRVGWAVVVLGGCFFPSVDGLSGDGGADVASADAGLCPPSTDPTLVAYYPCNEGSGTVVHDCSGHGFDAVLTGTEATTSWTAGHSGSAVLYVPANKICAVVTSPAANQSRGALTTSAWINPFAGIDGYIVGQRHQTGFGWRTDIEPDDAGNVLGFAVGSGDDAGDDFYASTLVATGGWHFVVSVFDPTGPTQTMWLDGTKLVANPGASAIVPDPIASTIRMGCRDDDTLYFSGVIDEVRIYSRALSDAEIVALSQQ